MNTQAKRSRPRYTLEFKQDASKLVNEKGYTHQQAADHTWEFPVAIDLFSRQVVGWAIADHMRTALCVRRYK